MNTSRKDRSQAAAAPCPTRMIGEGRQYTAFVAEGASRQDNAAWHLQLSGMKLSKTNKRPVRTSMPRKQSLELGIQLGREWVHRYSEKLVPVPPVFHYT